MKQRFTISITTIPSGVDPSEHLQQVMHDCPDCQAARARGEEPTIVMQHDPNESRQVRRARARKLMRGRR